MNRLSRPWLCLPLPAPLPPPLVPKTGPHRDGWHRLNGRPLTLMLPGTSVATAIGQVIMGAGVVLTFICSYMMRAFIADLLV